MAIEDGLQNNVLDRCEWEWCLSSTSTRHHVILGQRAFSDISRDFILSYIFHHISIMDNSIDLAV